MTSRTFHHRLLSKSKTMHQIEMFKRKLKDETTRGQYKKSGAWTMHCKLICESIKQPEKRIGRKKYHNELEEKQFISSINPTHYLSRFLPQMIQTAPCTTPPPMK